MKYNRVKKILYIIFFILIMLCILSSCVVTNATANMQDIYKGSEGANTLNSKAGNILWIVVAIGISAGVIMIAVIGFKYIVSSPEGKADLKKQLIPYFIGALILVSGGTFAGIIANIANKTLQF